MTELMVSKQLGSVEGIDPRLLQTAMNAQKTIENAQADNTKLAHESDWKHFVEWCVDRSVQYLPATTGMVALYLQDLSESYKTSTIRRKLSTISAIHQEHGYDAITTRVEPLKSVWGGIVREKGKARDKKTPVRSEEIKLMVSTLEDSLLGKRDKAILLVGFAGAFRRSELVGLDVEDIEFTRRGLEINIRQSKTDQGGEGQKIGIAHGTDLDTCPIRALQEWINASGITTGALFRPLNKHGQILGERTDRHRRKYSERLNGIAVARIVKKCAEAANLDPTKYAGHSLRSGLATTAAENGVEERIIMKQTRHKSVQMVREYIHDGDLFNNNASAHLGL